MDESSQDMAALGTPTEQHQELQALAGIFRSEVRLWMGPGDPMLLTGTMTHEIDLGGLFLRQTYVGDPSEGPFPAFEGRGFIGYNTVDKRWESLWIDNASPMLQIEFGDYDPAEKVWHLKGEMTNPQSGEPMAKRTVMTVVDDDRLRMEMYFGTPDGESKGMEIHYQRES